MKWRQSADQQVVEAVVRTLGARPEGLHGQLLSLTPSQWERSYHWLDASGTALYLLQRLEDLDITATLPRSTYARLRTNLSDNQSRSAAMLEELLDLNQAFQNAGVDYCNLKGFTLSPHSCPDPALRNQLDIDFLVDGTHLNLCSELLRLRGYVLHAVTNSVWEFKTQSDELASISDLYKTREQRCVELHFSFDEFPSRDRRLDQLHWEEREGVPFPTLSPVDQFLSQATHIFAHLCGPSTRLSWLYEFANHIAFRSQDLLFWEEIAVRSMNDSDTLIAVGVASLAVQELFATPLPSKLSSATIERIPLAVRQWTLHYAARSILADFPGTKLYLLLSNHLPHEDRGLRRALLPTQRPPRIMHLQQNASASQRFRSGLLQLRYEIFRLRFHVVEGIALLRELPRWRRILSGHRSSTQPAGKLRSSAVQSQ